MTIRARVTVAVLGTSAFALAAAFTTLLLLERARDREALAEEARSLARVLSAQVGEPLAQVEDERVAELLGSLAEHPGLASAAVFDVDRYRVAGLATEGAEAPTAPPPPGVHREGGTVQVVVPVPAPEEEADAEREPAGAGPEPEPAARADAAGDADADAGAGPDGAAEAPAEALPPIGLVHVALRSDASAAAGGLGAAALLGILALCLAPALLMAQHMRRSLAEPLQQLAEAAERLARGDFAARAALPRDDEVGSLGRSFDRMAESLRTLARNAGTSAREVLEAAGTVRGAGEASRERARTQDDSVRETEARLRSMQENLEQLAGVTERLASHTQDGAASASEVEASARSVAENMQELQGAIDSTTSSADQATSLAEGIAGRVVRLDEAAGSVVRAVESLGASVAEVAEQAAQSRALWEHSAEAVERGRRAAGDTAGAMGHLEERFTALDQAMHDLEERSGAIGEVVTVIDGVARETALLSLNASIIASQSGEHGRAFGVVAEQIKQLADRTAASTSEIQKLVEGVQARTREAVAATEEGGQAVASGVRRSKEAGEVLGQLQEAAQQSAETGRSIEGATARQSEELRGVTGEIAVLREGLAETRGDVEEQSAAMAAIVAAMKRVQNASAEATRAAGQQQSESERIGALVREIDQLTEKVRSAAELQLQGSRDLVESLAVFREGSQESVAQGEMLGRVVEQLAQRAEALERELATLRTGAEERAGAETGTPAEAQAQAGASA